MRGPRLRPSLNGARARREQERTQTGSLIDRDFEAASQIGESLAFDVGSVGLPNSLCIRVSNIYDGVPD